MLSLVILLQLFVSPPLIDIICIQQLTLYSLTFFLFLTNWINLVLHIMRMKFLSCPQKLTPGEGVDGYVCMYFMLYVYLLMLICNISVYCSFPGM